VVVGVASERWIIAGRTFGAAELEQIRASVAWLPKLAQRVGDDWDAHWGFRSRLLETVVDPARFRGTCYRAAGWHGLGTTRGRGLAQPGRAYRSTLRLIFVKPRAADFRRGLGVIPSRQGDGQ
jgi:hypothetical protein